MVYGSVRLEWSSEIFSGSISAGETSINNQRSWIYEQVVLWLTSILLKVLSRNPALKMETNQSIALWEHGCTYCLRWGTLVTEALTELSTKCLCYYYWQLLANSDSTGFCVPRLEYSPSHILSLKLQLLTSWLVPFISGYYHYYLPAFNWFVLWIYLCEPGAPQSFRCTTPHDGSLSC